MILSNKADEECNSKLLALTDQEIIINIDELLGWLEDCNWPVFTAVVDRLSNLGDALIMPISNILQSDDSILKTNIVGHLIPKFSVAAQQKYTELLKMLLNNPSDSDYQEGLIDYVEIQLSNIAIHT